MAAEEHKRLRDGAAAKVQVLVDVGAMQFQPTFMHRGELVAAERQEPQESRADLDFLVFGIDPSPLLALVTCEDSIEMLSEHVGVALESVREILLSSGSLHFPEKVIEEASKHARLRIDLCPHLG